MSVTTLLTEEEFLNLPDFAGRQEFRDGELIELPPAKLAHNALVKRIASFLRTVLDDSRVWTENGYWLRKKLWRIPDLSITWPDQPSSDDYFQGAPMIAIEVASRGNTPDELQEKVADYLEFGAAEVWVIYPKTRTMMVYLQNRTATLVEVNQDYHSDALDVTITPEWRTSPRRS